MRTRKEIEGAFGANYGGMEARRGQVEILLEVALDIRDLLASPFVGDAKLNNVDTPAPSTEDWREAWDMELKLLAQALSAERSAPQPMRASAAQYHSDNINRRIQALEELLPRLLHSEREKLAQQIARLTPPENTHTTAATMGYGAGKTAGYHMALADAIAVVKGEDVKKLLAND